MLFLALTILLNTYLFAVFKIFTKFRVDNLQAIVVNYWIAVITGSFFLNHFPVSFQSYSQPWLPWALLLGIGFISIFNLIAFCTKVDGITITTVANKLSLIIPVIFALFIYGDKMNPGKMLGIFIAFPAIYLSAKSNKTEIEKPELFWPILLFIGSGLLDTGMNFITKHFFTSTNIVADNDGLSIFLTHTFFVAGTIGTALVTFLIATKRAKFSWRNVLGGFVLGVPNYFSMYFLGKMLHSNYLQSSAIIPVNNIGIVVASAICAVIFFKEKAGPARVLGLTLAIVAILLIAFSDHYAVA